MKVILREDQSGVSEVVGTILILAMTVVLFSTIIIWVSNIPTPSAQTRVDIQSTMTPIYSGVLEVGVNITLYHRGGEALEPIPTLIYVTSQRGTNPPQTDIVILHRYNGLLATPSGLLDGTDTVWDIGERWAYQNYQLLSSDRITVAIVDKLKSIIIWTGAMNAVAGTRPPVFVDMWADGIPSTDAIDPVQATLGFYLYAKVADPDNDLNPNKVYANLTMWWGSFDPCSRALKMYDDGPAGGHGDRAAGDLVFTLASNCMSAPLPPLGWDGSIILLNATDLKLHQTTTRFVLHVVPQTTGGGGTTTIPSQLWQYIGFVQIRTGEVWYSHMNEVVGTSNKFQPYRVTTADLNGNGGALFHLQMANHGNRTIFIDGWTLSTFSAASRASVFTLYIVKPGDPTRPASSGGIVAYPDPQSATDPTHFAYSQVFNINPLDQETGGTPTVVLLVVKTAYSCCSTNNWVSDSYFMNILVSGMSGPKNMTYQQIINRWGPTYNPYTHLNDADPTTKTEWYAQVIPFIGMTVY